MEDEEDEEEEEEEETKPKVQPNVIRVPPPTYNSAGYPQHTAYQNPGYGQSAGYAHNPGYAQNPAYAQTLAFQQSMLNPQGFAQRAGYGALPQHVQVGCTSTLREMRPCSLAQGRDAIWSLIFTMWSMQACCRLARLPTRLE